MERRYGTRAIPHARSTLTWLACAWQVRTTYTGKLYGKQDDLCIAIQLSLIGCQKVCLYYNHPTRTNTAPMLYTVPAQFFQEGKYRNFRAPDFLTPQGLERKKPV